MPASLTKRDGAESAIAPLRVLAPERLRSTPVPEMPAPARDSGSALVMPPAIRRAAPAETTVEPLLAPRAEPWLIASAPWKTLVTPV